MRAFLSILAFCLASFPAWSQIPGGNGIVINNTQVQGGVSGDCLTVSSSLKVNQAVCGGAPSGAAGGVLSGTYPNPGFAAIATNTVLANATSGSAAPTAIAVGPCSATGSALTWTANTGFGCATGYAPLASPPFTGTVTMPDGATWASTGLANAASYTTSSTSIVNLTPTWNYSSTASAIAAMQISPVMVPTGASSANVSGLLVNPSVGTSAVNIALWRGMSLTGTMAAGYSGVMTAGTTLQVAFTNGGTNAVGTASVITLFGTANGNGIVTGTVSNSGLTANGATAAAASGGTINNYAVNVVPPTGSGAGTTSNYGLYISGNGGTGGGGTTNNYAIFSNSTAQTSILASGGFLLPSLTQTASAQSGTVCYNSSTGAITYDATLGCLASSERFKTDIVGIQQSDALALTMALSPVSFRKRGEFGGEVDPSYHVGFIAERVAEVDERLVSRNEDGVRGVRYQELTAILAGAIQELKREIIELKAAR